MEDPNKTRLIRRSSATQPPPPPPVPKSDDPEKTRILPRRDLVKSEETVHSDDDKTVILTPKRRSSGETLPTDDPMSDPLVGWLVIINGPGQGNYVRLGHGMNSIGRAEGQRCRLDYGDTEISRNSHATLSYDPRGRKFYIMHGGGQNLTYVGDAPVLQPVVLKGGEVISLGKTSLKFIPLCGEDFDWSQQMA